MLRLRKLTGFSTVLALQVALVLSAPAMAEKVKVYIMMGQSNMLGFGTVGPADKQGTLEYAIATDGLFPYLQDRHGWVVRDDARYAFIMSGRERANTWLRVPSRGRFGPELCAGFVLAEDHEAPVLMLKSCIGNRSLGWDLLPPGSERYEYEGFYYAGYTESPLKWKVGSNPEPIGWYAGKQYDTDVAGAKQILEQLDRYYPGAEGYEIAGFMWWQGDKDRYNQAHAVKYEENLVRLINVLREEFDAPDAKFVIATLGQTEIGAEGNEGKILQAMMNVADAEKYPQFEGNVATVYTHAMHQGGASNGHYGNNGKFYALVGEAMGKAMIELESE
ncbi:MAG: sialate O-acetylesterase [Planctomycetota bacterium]